MEHKNKRTDAQGLSSQMAVINRVSEQAAWAILSKSPLSQARRQLWLLAQVRAYQADSSRR